MSECVKAIENLIETHINSFGQSFKIAGNEILTEESIILLELTALDTAITFIGK